MRASTPPFVLFRASGRWIWLAAALTVAIFVTDLLTPPSVGIEGFYVLVILLTFWLPSVRATWLWAAVCTVFVAGGYLLSPPGGVREATVFNRALVVALLWGAAILSNLKKGSVIPFWLTVHQAPHAMLIVDRDGYIAFANAQAEALFGYRHRALEGFPVEILVPERFRGNHPHHRRTFVESLETRPLGTGRDLVAVRRDGTEIPVEIGLTHFRIDRRIFVVSTIVDLTERKRAEQAIAAQNKELQTLLDAVSHDFKEPLRGVEAFARLLDERGSWGLDEEKTQLLAHVRGSAARLRTLLEDLSTLSGARHGPTQRKPVDMLRLTEEALDRLRERIAERKARVELGGNLPRLAIDPTWAREAIVNLVSNALKFTLPGERSDIEIEGFQSHGQQGIVVRDRGPGVAPEDSERIFEPFQRAHGRDIEGTGAGLAIVRAVAERHGGRVWVQSRLGGGSEFFVTFGPRSDEETRMPSRAERTQTDAEKRSFDGQPASRPREETGGED